MPDKKIIIKKGSRVEITVKRKNTRQSAVRSQQSKGIIRSRSPEDYLPRRLGKGNIEFYNLGLWTIGDVYTNVPALVTRSIDFSDIFDWVDYVETNDVPPSGANMPLNADALTAADFQTREDNFFDVLIENDLSKLKTDFKRISETLTEFATEYETDGYFPFYAAIYSDTVFYDLQEAFEGNQPEWTPQGLKIPASFFSSSENIYVDFQDGAFQIKGDEKNHITATRDFEASAADFTPSPDMKFYCFPDMFVFVDAQIYENYPSGIITSELTGANFDTSFQTVRFDKLSPEYRKDIEHRWCNLTGENTPEKYEEIYEFASTYGQDLGLTSSADLEPADIFAPPPFDPQIPTSEGRVILWEYHHRFGRNTDSGLRSNNTLLAVIEQSGQFFYVWDN